MNWTITRRIKGDRNDPYVPFGTFTGTESQMRHHCHELSDADKASGGTVYEYKGSAA